MVTLKTGEVVQVMEKKDDGTFSGHPIKLARLRPSNGLPDLPWHLIGVFRSKGLDTSKTCHFARVDVRGKMICCGDILSEWLPQWLMSKTDT